MPELVGCRFPLHVLHELKGVTQRDFARLFADGQTTVLYGPVQWTNRLRTLLEMMRTAMEEPDYPGGAVPGASAALCGTGMHCGEQCRGTAPQ